MQLPLTSGAPLALAAALALAGLAPVDVHAQTALPLAPEVAHTAKGATAIPPIIIHISVAYASEEQGDVDPVARDIYEHLPAKYHSIQMIDDRTISVLFGEQAHVSLPTGSEVRLLPVAVHGGQLHLQLEMPEVLNTSMRLSNSRAFYVGGVPHGHGTLVFKLVPDFTPYIEAPPAQRAATPDTRKTSGAPR
jgi:hypothetical protein